MGILSTNVKKGNNCQISGNQELFRRIQKFVFEGTCQNDKLLFGICERGREFNERK